MNRSEATIAEGLTGDGATIAVGPSPGALGSRIRDARVSQDIGVRELARRVEVTPSFISQIERGRVMPSVGTLYSIVTELRVSMDDIFQVDTAPTPAEDDGPLLRADARQTIYLASGVRWEKLTQNLDPDLDFQFSTYAPGSESCPANSLMTHEGREWGILLRGSLQVTIKRYVYDLGPGDSISFSSTQPHRLANAGDEIAEALWIIRGRQEDQRLSGS